MAPAALPRISTCSSTTHQTTEPREVLGVSIPVASPATLIRTKNTYRPQDAIDRAFRRGDGRRLRGLRGWCREA